MMQVVQVARSTYYFDLPSVIGLYVFQDQTCCLIDSGEQTPPNAEVQNYLKQQGYQVKAILSTHFHPDHSAGHGWWQERQACAIYASPFEAALLENPELSPFSLYTASPLKVLKNRFLLAPRCQVTHRVNQGIQFIEGEEFAAVNLPGHTLGQLGWVTPDGVLFAGDSVIAPGILSISKLNYTADVGKHIHTLEDLNTSGYSQVITAHGGLLPDLAAAIAANQEAVELLLTKIRELLGSGELSIEDVVAALITELELPFNYSQYFLFRATVSAYLAYLCQQRAAITRLKEGRLLFTGKR